MAELVVQFARELLAFLFQRARKTQRECVVPAAQSDDLGFQLIRAMGATSGVIVGSHDVAWRWVDSSSSTQRRQSAAGIGRPR